jgi:hypothetical protein
MKSFGCGVGKFPPVIEKQSSRTHVLADAFFVRD